MMQSDKSNEARYRPSIVSRVMQFIPAPVDFVEDGARFRMVSVCSFVILYFFLIQQVFSPGSISADSPAAVSWGSTMPKYLFINGTPPRFPSLVVTRDGIALENAVARVQVKAVDCSLSVDGLPCSTSDMQTLAGTLNELRYASVCRPAVIGAEVRTDSVGIALFNDLVMAGPAGSYLLEMSVDAVSAGESGALTALVMYTGLSGYLSMLPPSSGTSAASITVGQALTPAPSFLLTDSRGVGIAGATVQAYVWDSFESAYFFNDQEFKFGELSEDGSSAVTNAAGVATFNRLVVVGSTGSRLFINFTVTNTIHASLCDSLHLPLVTRLRGLHVQTLVLSVQLQDASTYQNLVVQEGVTLPVVTVRVSCSGGCHGRRVYAVLESLNGRAMRQMQFQAPFHRTPKTISGSWSTTDGAGYAVFSSLRFSKAGEVGSFSIVFVCDGVHSDLLSGRVTSSISRIEILENSLPLEPPVVRATDYNFVVLLSDREGPVEGRAVTISVLSEPVAGLTTVELVDFILNNGRDTEPVSDIEGLISFTVTFGYVSSAPALLKANMTIAADGDTFVVLPLSFAAIDHVPSANETIPEGSCFISVRDSSATDRVWGARPVVPGVPVSLDFSIVGPSGLPLSNLAFLQAALQLQIFIRDSSNTDVSQDARVLDLNVPPGRMHDGSVVTVLTPGQPLMFSTSTNFAKDASLSFALTSIKTGYYSVTFQLVSKGSVLSEDSIDPNTGEPVAIDVSNYLRIYGITSCNSKSFDIFVSNPNRPLQPSNLRRVDTSDVFPPDFGSDVEYALDLGRIAALSNASSLSLHWITAPRYLSIQGMLEQKQYIFVYSGDFVSLGRVFYSVSELAAFAELQNPLLLTRELRFGFFKSSGGNLTFSVLNLGVYSEPFVISLPRPITSIAVHHDVPSSVSVSHAFGSDESVVSVQVTAPNVSGIVVLAELKSSSNCTGAINYDVQDKLAFSSSLCSSDDAGLCSFVGLTLIDAVPGCDYWLEFKSPYYLDDAPLAVSRHFTAIDTNTTRTVYFLDSSASVLTLGGSVRIECDVGIRINGENATLGYSFVFRMLGFSTNDRLQMQQRVNGGTCFVYWSTLSEINMYRMFGDCSGSVIYSQADSSLQANFKLPTLRIPSLSVAQSAFLMPSLTPKRIMEPGVGLGFRSASVQVVAVPNNVVVSLQPVKRGQSAKYALLETVRTACRVMISGGAPLPFAQAMVFPIFLGKSPRFERPTTIDAILQLIQASSMLLADLPSAGVLNATTANDILEQATPESASLKELSMLLKSPGVMRAIGGGATLDPRTVQELTSKKGVALFNLRFTSAQDGYYCIAFLCGNQLSLPSEVFQITNKIRSISILSKVAPKDNQVDVTKGPATVVMKEFNVQLHGDKGPVDPYKLPTVLVSTTPSKQTSLQSKVDAILRLVRLGLGDRGADVVSSASITNKHSMKAIKAVRVRSGVYMFPEIQITSSTPSSITICVQADGVKSDQLYAGDFLMPVPTWDSKVVEQVKVALFFIFASILAVGNTHKLKIAWIPLSMVFAVALFYLVWTYEYPPVTAMILYVADCVGFLFLALALYSEIASRPSLLFYHRRQRTQQSHVIGMLRSFRWVALASRTSAAGTGDGSRLAPGGGVTKARDDEAGIADCVLCQSSAAFSCHTCRQLFCGPCMLSFHRNAMIEHVVIRGTGAPWLQAPLPVAQRPTPIKMLVSYYVTHTRGLIRGILLGADAFHFPQRLLVALSISVIAVARVFDGVLSLINSVADSIPVLEAEVVSKVMLVLQLREYEYFNRMLLDMGWQPQSSSYENIQFLHNQARDLMFAVRFCFNLGAVVGFTWFLLSVVMVLVDTRVLLLAARRQQVDLGVNTASFLGACSYIGNQISCSIVGYGLFSFLVGIILMPLVWKPLRDLVLGNWIIILALLWPVVLKALLKTLAFKFLTSQEGINYRGGFAVYDLVISGLSLVAGFVAAAARIVMLLVASFVSVGRIERNAFPEWVVINLDGCNASYVAMLRLHHMHNQPVVAMFVEQLLLIGLDVKVNKQRRGRGARRMQVALLLSCYPSLRCLRKAYIAHKRESHFASSNSLPQVQSFSKQPVVSHSSSLMPTYSEGSAVALGAMEPSLDIVHLPGASSNLLPPNQSFSKQPIVSHSSSLKLTYSKGSAVTLGAMEPSLNIIHQKPKP